MTVGAHVDVSVIVCDGGGTCRRKCDSVYRHAGAHVDVSVIVCDGGGTCRRKCDSVYRQGHM